MKRKLLALFIIILLIFIVGCDGDKVSKDLKKQQNEIYQLAVEVGYNGTFEEWLETVKGDQGTPGEDGKNIELIVSGDYIKWRNEGDSNWNNLVSIDSLIGPNGSDGKEVDFQVIDGVIQWKYTTDTTWTNLVELSTLVGPIGNDGVDGKEVVFQVAEGFIQWQYTTDTIWTNLVELSTLVGSKGLDGVDGKEVVFQVADGFIQWNYDGDTIWNNLVELSTLKGFDGQSAYQTYIEFHPEYTKTSLEWMNDLVNGRLADKVMVTVNFNTQGGSLPTGTEVSKSIEKGNTINLPVPTKVGYTFSGWSSGLTVNDDKFTNTNPVLNDLTLYAVYSENEYDINYYDYNNLDFIKVASGYNHTIALTSSYRVYAWGQNDKGQLGDGTTEDKFTPIDITPYFNLRSNEWISNVNTGLLFSVAITSDKRVFTWGDNFSGQLGDGTTRNRFLPTDITSSFNLGNDEFIYDFSCGSTFSILFTSLNRVFGWGANNSGQLADPNLSRKVLPTDITSNIVLQEYEGIVKITTGSSHTLIYTTRNRVLTWGSNTYGQLGDGTISSRSTPTDITARFSLGASEGIKYIASGETHSILVTTANRIFSWGENNFGQLGDGTESNRISPVEITSNFNLQVDDDITKISTKADHNLLLTSTNLVFTWGYNFYGQLGDGSNQSSSLPIMITPSFQLQSNENIESVYAGCQHSMAISTDNQVFTWGNNLYGQLGNKDTSNRLKPTEITSEFNLVSDEIVEVIAGQLHAFGISSSGKVYAWGLNGNGQLGIGTTSSIFTPVEITSAFNLLVGERVIEMSAGSNFSYAITSYGRVFAWGYNYYRLGDGTTINRLSPVEITSNFNLVENEMIIKIEAGNYQSIAISSSNRVFTWGINQHGQLGDGTRMNSLLPIDITSNFDLAEKEEIINLISGENHSLVITSNNRVFAWGDNAFGQLGTNDNVDRLLPTEITTNFDLKVDETITSISSKLNHNLALSSSGRVFSWGLNTYGRLGDKTNENKSTPVDITPNFKLYSKEKITSVIVGDDHSVAYTSNNRLFAWGYNIFGQLGNDTQDNKYQPEDITEYLILNESENISEVTLGCYFNILRTSENRLLAWGHNVYGQLGLTNDWLPEGILDWELEESKSFKYGTSVNDLEAPVKEGYVFIGYYLDKELTQPLKILPANDINVYIQWIKE